MRDDPRPDRSNGYEAIASTFILGRGRNYPGLGTTAVADWSRMFAAGASILDIGCGCGVPISMTLIERGFKVYGVDASPTLIAAFAKRFPSVPLDCSSVEESTFFNRTFDGVVSWGLFFLLDADAQRTLIAKIGKALTSGGRLVFTSPSQVCSWTDAMTGQVSVSLGREGYRAAMEREGLTLVDEREDEGENHYYFVVKT